MTELAIEFSVTPSSFFNKDEIKSSFLIVIIDINIISNNSKFKQKSLLKSSINKNNGNSNSNFMNKTPIYFYDAKLISIEKLNEITHIEEYFKSFVSFQPRAHQRSIISLKDSVLFLHPKNYIQIEQELNATNESILDTSISIRIQSILELLKLS